MYPRRISSMQERPHGTKEVRKLSRFYFEGKSKMNLWHFGIFIFLGRNANRFQSQFVRKLMPRCVANSLHCGETVVAADRWIMTSAVETSERECSLKREKFGGTKWKASFVFRLDLTRVNFFLTHFMAVFNVRKVFNVRNLGDYGPPKAMEKSWLSSEDFLWVSLCGVP